MSGSNPINDSRDTLFGIRQKLLGLNDDKVTIGKEVTVEQIQINEKVRVITRTLINETHLASVQSFESLGCHFRIFGNHFIFECADTHCRLVSVETGIVFINAAIPAASSARQRRVNYSDNILVFVSYEVRARHASVQIPVRPPKLRPHTLDRVA